MKIHFKNLGAIKQADFELGDFTIICGSNNTGKTYATYALYGFLSVWRTALQIKVDDKNVSQLLETGHTSICIDDYIKIAPEILKSGCIEYKSYLPTVFASDEKTFELTEFNVTLDTADIKPIDAFERRMGAAKADLFLIRKNKGEKDINITLLVEKEKVSIPKEIIKRTISDSIKDIIFGHLFPNPFIASAERTGAAIFRKELNFARNRLLEQMSSSEKNINTFELLTKVYTDYALPVKANVDFTRQLEDLVKRESFLVKINPGLLDDFTDIIGGEYTVTKDDQLYYITKSKRIKLSMNQSSSAVRALLDIGFYLRHVANPGDLLIVDEPELNLHPENQRRIARLFARLVNTGIKVFITTHSDYIIKELNSLIMLSDKSKPHLLRIIQEEKYKDEELLSSKKMKVYIAEEALVKLEDGKRSTRCQTLVPADIDPELGIEARSFDKTIEDMNRIQEAIIWGGNE